MVHGQIHIGTSGYMYKHWRGILYPNGLPSLQWINRYAEVFRTVELNATFYRLPEVSAVRGWHDRTPADFLIICKGSRYLTHIKRLKDAGAGLRLFYSRIRWLKEKLGPVLWQLPPTMSKADPGRLDAFLKAQPKDIRCAVEFRHPAWYTPEICDVLERHGAAFCEHDHIRLRPPRLTGGWRYIRFHGATAKHEGRYGRRALAPYARDLRRWADSGREAFVYFNNDARGAAIYDAVDLSSMLGKPLPFK